MVRSNYAASRGPCHALDPIKAPPRFCFLLINLAGGTYIFRIGHRFFDREANIDNDIPAVRHVRLEVIMIPSLALTSLPVILLNYFWCA